MFHSNLVISAVYLAKYSSIIFTGISKAMDK